MRGWSGAALAVVCSIGLCLSACSSPAGSPAQPQQAAAAGQSLVLYLLPNTIDFEHPPTVPPSGEQGTTSVDVVFTNASHILTYFAYEPGYTGMLTIASSCPAKVLAEGLFVTPGPPNSNTLYYTANVSGPSGILSVGSTGVFGAGACTYTVSDAKGQSAKVSVHDKQLLVYSQTFGSATPAPGALGSTNVNAGNNFPPAVTFYEHGYAGKYALSPITCPLFTATFKPPTAPGGSAVLTTSPTGIRGPQVCVYVVSDANGQQATDTVYEEGF